MTALFKPLGEDMFEPTERARGPWDRNALHGGPVTALLTRAIELLPAEGPMHFSRITVELLRPAPVTALRVTSSVLRPGRKVQLGTASLWAGDAEVCRAVGLRIRAAAIEAPDLAGLDGIDDPPPPMGVTRNRPDADWEWEGFHNHGVEMRFTDGFFGDPGPATVWMRLRQPVVPGEEPTPAQRMMAVADFGNGVSSVLPWDRYLFINPDLSVHVSRLPVGEWVCLDSRTFPTPESGVGLAESALYDEKGRIGRAVQSLLLDRR